MFNKINAWSDMITVHIIQRFAHFPSLFLSFLCWACIHLCLNSSKSPRKELKTQWVDTHRKAESCERSEKNCENHFYLKLQGRREKTIREETERFCDYWSITWLCLDQIFIRTIIFLPSSAKTRSSNYIDFSGNLFSTRNGNETWRNELHTQSWLFSIKIQCEKHRTKLCRRKSGKSSHKWSTMKKLRKNMQKGNQVISC